MSNRAAKITPEHLEESKRLRALWDAKEGKPSQAAFGHDYGIGGQAAVWRFLNGRDPLSMKAAIGFAKGLGCDISAFSPRLAAEAAAAAAVSKPAAKSKTGAIPNLLELAEQEAQLLLMFRDLTPSQQHQLLVKANKLYVATHPGKSKANPFPDIKTTVKEES
jgi:hypothetical protein